MGRECIEMPPHILPGFGYIAASKSAGPDIVAFSADSWDAPRDDNFSIDGEHDDDGDEWQEPGSTAHIAVHSDMKRERSRSPVLRLLVWLCGTPIPDDEDRPPLFQKVAVD
jgi:hypothetical protein